MSDSIAITPGKLSGTVAAPVSKSSLHRLLIASFLSAGRFVPEIDKNDSDDIVATKRCLAALSAEGAEVELDCGESGSTLRFLAPVAAALGKKARFIRRGRLAQRPMIEYGRLEPGRHELPGDVSSQFVTGLLFALPLLPKDSEICFTSPLESRGYVDMTLAVLRDFGIGFEMSESGIRIAGGQRYEKRRDISPEGDWSGAAFWFAANALGCQIAVSGLDGASAQPDRAVCELLGKLGGEINVSQCPDLLPALAVAAAGADGETRFTGAARLRIKESDRLAAMQEVLARLGVKSRCTEDSMLVRGIGERRFTGGAIESYGDHRIAMAAAVAAVRAESDVVVLGHGCVSKSYPGFWDIRASLARASDPLG